MKILKFVEKTRVYYWRLCDYKANRKGQTLVEYVLILIMIALAIIVAMLFLQAKIENTYNNAAERMPYL